MPAYNPEIAVDLAPLAELSDREVAICLGSRKPDLDAHLIAQERSGANDKKRPYGLARCQGASGRLGLQCRNTTLRDQPWCGVHLPKVIPPAALPQKVEKPVLRQPPAVPSESAAPDDTQQQALPPVVEGVREAVEQVVHLLTEIARQVAALSARPTKPKPLLTVEEAAEYLHISTQYLYKLTKEKLVPYVRLGNSLRFETAALEKWVRDKSIPAVPMR